MYAKFCQSYFSMKKISIWRYSCFSMSVLRFYSFFLFLSFLMYINTSYHIYLKNEVKFLHQLNPRLPKATEVQGLFTPHILDCFQQSRDSDTFSVEFFFFFSVVSKIGPKTHIFFQNFITSWSHFSRSDGFRRVFYRGFNDKIYCMSH